MTTTTETPEARIFPFGLEIRDLETTDSLSMLSGRAVPYNAPTDLGTFTEEVAPGCFARSIKQDAVNLPLHLFHGDAVREGGHPATPWPIGIAHEWRDGRDALRGVWRLDQGDEAQKAARMAKDGMLPYLSVRFQPYPNKTDIRYDDSDRPHLIRRQARLVSTSLVSTPAYREAGVEWVRSAEQVARPGSPGTSLAEWTAYLEQIRQGPASEIRRDMTAGQRRRKPTLPGSDTAWPIGDTVDLKAAIQSYGRAKPEDREKVKAWIVRRARELGALGLLPESWNVKK